jgi:5-formyltetrahydrofolate cyclo-ligase
LSPRISIPFSLPYSYIDTLPNYKERIKLNKKELRKHVLSVRGQMDSKVREEKSRKIVEQLLNFPIIKDVNLIFSFLSFGNEVDVRPFLEESIRVGKKIAIPKAWLKDRIMIPYLFAGWDSLKPGLYGILEPDPDTAQKVTHEEIDAVIVPGVAFDQKGGRLGYGGGFYDRYLAGFKKCPPLIAVCFSEQLLDQVPVKSHDYKVDYIVTENGILSTKIR